MPDPSFTVGSFAESLINSEIGKVQEDPSYMAEATSTQSPGPNVPDLRQVEVPKNFMSQILGEDVEPDVEPDVEQEPVQNEPVESLQTLNEETVVLIEKLHSLVRDLDGVLSELTSAGMLGVRQGVHTRQASSFIKSLRSSNGYKKATRSKYKR